MTLRGHHLNVDKLGMITITPGGGGGKEVHELKEAWRCARIETNEN